MGTSTTPSPSPLITCINVCVDGNVIARPLSYTVPLGLKVYPGDAVKVPFGTKIAYGIVLGSGDTKKATRPIIEVYPQRVSQQELDFAVSLATQNFCEVSSIASRLAPRTGKSAPALNSGPVKLLKSGTIAGLGEIPPKITRRYLLCAPLVDKTYLAAIEAQRLSKKGQVLILCPTIKHVTATTKHFASGVSSLDSLTSPGSWKGFSEGSLVVAVGTRTTALYSAANLAAIIVVEEDHPAHKELRNPYTNARDLAISRSNYQNCDLVLIGSCPTVHGLAGQVKVFNVGSSKHWPTMIVSSTKDQDPALEIPRQIATLVKKSASIILVDNYTKLLCTSCKSPRRIKSRPGSLSFSVPTPCKICGSNKVLQVNWDKTRALATFPTAIPCDLNELAMMTPQPWTIVLPSFDRDLTYPHHLPEAKALRNILTVAEAATAGGKVVILTRTKSCLLLRDLVNRDLKTQARRTWALAKKANLPPLGLWVKITHKRKTAPRTKTWTGNNFRVLGPLRKSTGWESIIQVPVSERTNLAVLIAKIKKSGKVKVEIL